jgi:hypothetical protein
VDAPADHVLESNAYAVSYRLLGDRPAAAAVAGIAAERLRQSGQHGATDWLCKLTLYTVEQSVGPGALSMQPSEEDPASSLRTALRRRLVRATPEERAAASLHHLAGYPIDFVATAIGTTPQEAKRLAGVLAPPPGVAYRELGDPQLIRVESAQESSERRRRRPSWSTIVAMVVIAAAVLVATQFTGPRPTLGPPVSEEGRSAVEFDLSESQPRLGVSGTGGR